MDNTKPDESKLERVIRKIKRCLALSKSANEHEAATAMRQAQALMREHRLSENDVHVSDVGEATSATSRAVRRPIWDQQLSFVVAKAFNCTALRHTHWDPVKERRVERAKFVGVTPAQHIALYAYEALLLKVKQARSEYVAGVRCGRNKSRYSAETAGDHFALAWAFEVGSKLDDLVPKGEDGEKVSAASAGTDLVAAESQDKALIEHYLSSIEIIKARKSTPLEMDLNAQIAGMLAGSRVEIHAGLATGDRQAQISGS